MRGVTSCFLYHIFRRSSVMVTKQDHVSCFDPNETYLKWTFLEIDGILWKVIVLLDVHWFNGMMLKAVQWIFESSEQVKICTCSHFYT